MDINATLIGQSIAMVVFVWFTMKFVWPPLNNAIEERQKKIADGLAASERAEKDLEKAHEQVAAELNKAKAEAAEIIEQARKRANKIVDDETQRGHEEREKIIASGHAEIVAERNRAREELRKQVAILAVAGAEKIIQREVDAAKQSDIVDKLVAEL
ncbi:F0F1 ATP synthase subunit B [Aliidiomarina maris]|uniref:ATP synthase subunit b n=1 Tax=Aliidiomarina maris TaxID=531312 RepID=A0A327WYX9_9GAMM|nr:F0F1 ATP synthase subunit B [Aliidiomarina maris]MBA3988805.1 F0F1 ATP synthase subunit B [Idiomarina sp.]RAJ97068.1 ATP synthase F0 subcomplex B subunit [Aliidiomarina maris]RUO24670.1 F0F1 ATP synthase subunit B [Aliidiomarina maris]